MPAASKKRWIRWPKPARCHGRARPGHPATSAVIPDDAPSRRSGIHRAARFNLDINASGEMDLGSRLVPSLGRDDD
jgi:hypothetical protein